MNPAALLLFALSAVGFGSGVAFGVAVGEETGTALLIGAGLAAGIGGLAIVGTQGRDVPAVEGGRQPASLASSGSSVWPFACGIAALLIATGLATGRGLVTLGMAAAMVAGVGWFAQSWAAHPSWTDEQNERVSARLILPIVLPLGVTALVLTIAVSFSRILLAVDSNTSVLLALVAALLILGTGVLVAVRGLGRSAILSLLTVGAMATAGVGVGGAVAGERDFHHKGGESAEHAAEGETNDGHSGEAAEEGGPEQAGEADGAHGDAGPDTAGPGAAAAAGEPEASSPPRVELEADGLQFDKKALTLPAGEVTTIVFRNEEGQPHNVAIRDDGGSPIFRPEGGGIITGPGKEVEYKVPPIAPGEYTFFCEVHPAAMNGELTVA
ncbi:MAG TPA: cupredoxin domain-containing protein [Acidimicrobiales bacterium]|nr:cupredoxin domain-containing protein [Acidimicrobiales bacterium]